MARRTLNPESGWDRFATPCSYNGTRTRDHLESKIQFTWYGVMSSYPTDLKKSTNVPTRLRTLVPYAMQKLPIIFAIKMLRGEFQCTELIWKIERDLQRISRDANSPEVILIERNQPFHPEVHDRSNFGRQGRYTRQ